MRRQIWQGLAAGAAVVIGGCSLTGCIQDASCSAAGQSKMNAAVVDVLQAAPGQVGYISTPDCESGSPLSATLTLQISWADLMLKLSDRCEAAGVDATCRLGGNEFDVFFVSEDDADGGVVVQIGG